MVSNVYVEHIATAARMRLVQKGIISADTKEYSKKTLESIIDFFGGRIIKDVHHNEDSGQVYIKKIAEDSFEIHLPDNENWEKRFMEIIHELGHAFVDFPSEPIGEMHRFDGRTASDVQAELFARAFVMPAIDFIESAKKCIVAGKFDIQKIADIYHVKYVDALIRGKELNYWE